MPALNRRALRLLSLGGVLAPPVFVVSVVVATVLTPGYSHVSDTISQLAAPGTPHPEVLQAGFTAYGLLVLGPTFALFTYLRGTRVSLLTLSLMLVYCVSGVLAAIFRDGARGLVTPTTSTGDLHDYVALSTYGAIMGTMLVGWWFFRGVHGWRGFAWFSLAMVVATGALGLAFNFHDAGYAGVPARLLPHHHGLDTRGLPPPDPPTRGRVRTAQAVPVVAADETCLRPPPPLAAPVSPG